MLTVALVALKLVVALVVLPFKLVAALAGGIIHVVLAFIVVCVMVVAIALLPILLVLFAVAGIAIALLG